MKFIKKNCLFVFLFLGLCSCGADTLKKTTKNEPQALSANCSFDSTYSPVCSDGIDFENISQAQCKGATNIKPGHCDCAKNSINVCGSDGVNYTECFAKEHNITIEKYIPCEAAGL
jgi:hypothetical protein